MVAHYVIDILRNVPTTAQDKRRFDAKNNSEAIAEAQAIFSQMTADPTVTAYRVRELRRRGSVFVYQANRWSTVPQSGRYRFIDRYA